MSFTKTSMTAIVAIGFVAAAGVSASACEWHQQQVNAKISTPAAEEQAESSASPIDPVLLARIESREKAESPEQN